jgi:lantibiotic modifying enzyme
MVDQKRSLGKYHALNIAVQSIPKIQQAVLMFTKTVNDLQLIFIRISIKTFLLCVNYFKFLSKAVEKCNKQNYASFHI